MGVTFFDVSFSENFEVVRKLNVYVLRLSFDMIMRSSNGGFAILVVLSFFECLLLRSSGMGILNCLRPAEDATGTDYRLLACPLFGSCI